MSRPQELPPNKSLQRTFDPLGDQILISYKIAFTQYHYGDPQIRMKAIAIHIAPINTTHSRDSPSNANLR
jgi:hypothetical protein